MKLTLSSWSGLGTGETIARFAANSTIATNPSTAGGRNSAARAWCSIFVPEIVLTSAPLSGFSRLESSAHPLGRFSCGSRSSHTRCRRRGESQSALARSIGAQRQRRSPLGHRVQGLNLRLLRDNVALTRLAYVEFDLQAMFAAISVPMPSALRPLLERIRKSKQKCTVEFPFQPSRRWQQFFIKIKKTHLTFHCLRVTCVNRLRRAKVPREAAMRLVNHASELIHQIYQREKVEDVAQWQDAVQFPA
jgi:hypothetical protein